MIRGQAKTPATVPHHQHHHHQRNPSSSSQRTTYLNLPGLQRSTETSVSRRSSASPSPSSNNTIHSGSVPIRTRPERLAKTQAKAALRISPDGTEASGNSDEDEELASGSDDDLRGAHNNRSANTSIDVDHLMASSAGVKDSGKIGGGYSDVPKLFDSSSGRGGPASSTATPSFPNSPLHVSGGLGELDGGFSADFSIHGLGGADSSMDGIMNDNVFSGFGSGMHDLSSGGAEDPYANLDLGMGSSGMGVGFDFFAATLAAGAIGQAHHHHPHHHQKEQHMPMTISIPPKATMEVNVTAVQPDSISPPILSSATTGTTVGGGSASGSPLVGTTTTAAASTNNHSRRPSIPAIGMTVTSPTGITLPAGFSNPAAFTGMMMNASSTDGSSYFPPRPITTSPPPVPTVQTTPPLPNNNNRARSKTATPTLPGVPSAASAPARGYYPQPAQPFPSFVPNGAQQQTPAFGTLTISYKPQIRTPLADPNRSLSSFQETLVFYYFNRGVRRMQYLLADDSTTGVTDVMYDLVIRDPLG